MSFERTKLGFTNEKFGKRIRPCRAMLRAATRISATAGRLGGAVRRASTGPEAWATMKLVPRGQRVGADSGDPQMSNVAFAGGNTLGSGLWECEPGGFPVNGARTHATCARNPICVRARAGAASSRPNHAPIRFGRPRKHGDCLHRARAGDADGQGGRQKDGVGAWHLAHAPHRLVRPLGYHRDSAQNVCAHQVALGIEDARSERSSAAPREGSKSPDAGRVSEP